MQTPKGVEATLREKDSEKFLFILNHNDTQEQITITTNCVDLISKELFTSGDIITMPKKDVKILSYL